MKHRWLVNDDYIYDDIVNTPIAIQRKLNDKIK
jgi:hypothetical protein